MQTEENRSRGLRLLSWAFYAFAIVVLVMAVLAALSVGNASAVVPAATIGFQSPALKPMWDALVDGLRWFGFLLFSLGFTVSLLFACCGSLLGYAAGLERRLMHVESALPAGDTSEIGAAGGAVPASPTSPQG